MDIATWTVRTKPGPYYLPPLKSEVETALMQHSINVSHYDLVGDIINLCSEGGDFTSYDESKYSTLLPGNRRPDNMTREYDSNIVEYLRQLRTMNVFAEAPGTTPLRKAINILKLSCCSLTMESFAAGTTGESAVKAAKLTKQNIDAVNGMDGVDKELLSRGGSEDAIVDEMTVGKLELMKISRQLKQLSRLSMHAGRTDVSDMNGKRLVQTPMEDINDLPRISQAELCQPQEMLEMRLLSGRAVRYDRTVRTARRQLLYIIMDCSGSMYGSRANRACGVVMNRARGVVAGEAELFFRFFDEKCWEEERHVRTAEEARALMEYVLRNAYDGGTDIPKSVRAAVDRIHALRSSKELCRPELAVITDGQSDMAGFDGFSFGGVVMHAFIIGGKNQQLVNIAIGTGGVGLQWI